MQLVSYSARLLADGLAVGSAGNISVRAGDTVAITPSGVPYGEMRAADVCLITLDGAQLPGGAGHLFQDVLIGAHGLERPLSFQRRLTRVDGGLWGFARHGGSIAWAAPARIALIAGVCRTVAANTDE